MVRKRILLANDSELLRSLRDSFFGRSGFVLLVADSEDHAFEVIEEQDPALAIFNLEQPGFNGDACCRRIKSDPILRGTPIILVVHSEGERELALCREAGCDEILHKPLDSDDLMDAACRLLKIANRGELRTHVDLPLRWGKDINKLSPGRILNLNNQGAFISADKFFPVDTTVHLKIFITGSNQPLCCTGRVAWVNHPEWLKTTNLPTGMGVQFLDLAPENTDLLREYLDQMAEKED